MQILKCFLAFLMLSVLNATTSLDEMPYSEELDDFSVELLISYKVIIKDNLAQGEKYSVSHALNYKGTDGFKVAKKCEIKADSYPIMDDMPYFITLILKQEKEQVLDCFFANEILVREVAQGKNNALSAKSSLEIAPTRVIAKLVNKSIMLYILAKDNA